jgi:Zn-dependent oligopeptidase
MTDCLYTTKDAAVELLANHRATKAEKPKDAFQKIEATKKVGRVLFNAKNTSLATMARVEGKIDG